MLLSKKIFCFSALVVAFTGLAASSFGSSCGFELCKDTELNSARVGLTSWSKINEEVCRWRANPAKFTKVGEVRPFSFPMGNRRFTLGATACSIDMHSHACFQELMSVSAIENDSSDTEEHKVLKMALKFIDAGSSLAFLNQDFQTFNIFGFIESRENQGWLRTSMFASTTPSGEETVTLHSYMSAPEVAAARMGLNNICEAKGKATSGFFGGLDSWLGKNQQDMFPGPRLRSIALKKDPITGQFSVLFPALENGLDINLPFKSLDQKTKVYTYEGSTFSGPAGVGRPLKMQVKLKSMMRRGDCSNTEHMMGWVFIEDPATGFLRDEGFLGLLAEFRSPEDAFPENSLSVPFCIARRASVGM